MQYEDSLRERAAPKKVGGLELPESMHGAEVTIRLFHHRRTRGQKVREESQQRRCQKGAWHGENRRAGWAGSAQSSPAKR